MKNKKLKASFTIEAAFIVPLVMVVIVGVIFIAFMAHDMVTMDALSSYTIIDNAGKDNEEIIQSTLRQKLSKGLIITKDIQVDGKKRSDGYIVKTCGNFSIPTIALSSLFGTSTINESSQISISNLDGRGALLKNKAIADGIKNIGEKNQ